MVNNPYDTCLVVCDNWDLTTLVVSFVGVWVLAFVAGYATRAVQYGAR